MHDNKTARARPADLRSAHADVAVLLHAADGGRGDVQPSPRRGASTRYTVTREETETIEWTQGTIDAERWHRRSDDGKTDAYVWLAPSLHYIPVKMRVVNTDRGTIEVLLDSIRVDEAKAEQ